MRIILHAEGGKKSVCVREKEENARSLKMSVHLQSRYISADVPP